VIPLLRVKRHMAVAAGMVPGESFKGAIEPVAFGNEYPGCH